MHQARPAWAPASLDLRGSRPRARSGNLCPGRAVSGASIFARNQGARGATAARLEQARETLSALERRVFQEVRLAAERVRAAQRMVAAFDPAMASALAEDLALATRAYDAGQIDFLRLQLIRRDAIDARRERIDALEALSRATARLDGVLGQGLPPN